MSEPMNATTPEPNTEPDAQPAVQAGQAPDELLQWETPTSEDVSEQVMAQPYIRFT